MFRDAALGKWLDQKGSYFINELIHLINNLIVEMSGINN